MARTVLTREELTRVAEGQSERTILDQSKKGYLSKMKVMTNILNDMPEAITLG